MFPIDYLLQTLSTSSQKLDLHMIYLTILEYPIWSKKPETKLHKSLAPRGIYHWENSRLFHFLKHKLNSKGTSAFGSIENGHLSFTMNQIYTSKIHTTVLLSTLLSLLHSTLEKNKIQKWALGMVVDEIFSSFKSWNKNSPITLCNTRYVTYLRVNAMLNPSI